MYRNQIAVLRCDCQIEIFMGGSRCLNKSDARAKLSFSLHLQCTRWIYLPCSKYPSSLLKTILSSSFLSTDKLTINWLINYLKFAKLVEYCEKYCLNRKSNLDLPGGISVKFFPWFLWIQSWWIFVILLEHAYLNIYLSIYLNLTKRNFLVDYYCPLGDSQ